MSDKNNNMSPIDNQFQGIKDRLSKMYKRFLILSNQEIQGGDTYMKEAEIIESVLNDTETLHRNTAIIIYTTDKIKSNYTQ